MRAELGILFFILINVIADTATDVAVVIISQSSDFDYEKVKEAENRILSVRQDVNVVVPNREYPDIFGHWSIWPLITRLNNDVRVFKWYLFVEVDSFINWKNLDIFIEGRDPNRLQYYSYPLTDRGFTIIHHFYGYDTSEKFEYPDVSAGILMSHALINELAEKLVEDSQSLGPFSIDPKHELARFILERCGVRLSSFPNTFCLRPDDSCAVAYKEPEYDNCGGGLDTSDVFFAIKTFSGNHRSRVVIVKRTWSRDLELVEYVSDVIDPYVPTIEIGVNNTERGHCGKTLAILRRFAANGLDTKVDWLVIADDDTLLSVSRLLQLLACYTKKDEIILGERYGFGFSFDGSGGYDYPTGGASMIFSRAAVNKLLEYCTCPTDDAPDDMIIGQCARIAGISVLHNSAFHQARERDYAEEYVRKLRPISYHKFEEIDPYYDYMHYLHESSNEGFSVHEEL